VAEASARFRRFLREGATDRGEREALSPDVDNDEKERFGRVCAARIDLAPHCDARRNSNKQQRGAKMRRDSAIFPRGSREKVQPAASSR